MTYSCNKGVRLLAFKADFAQEPLQSYGADELPDCKTGWLSQTVRKTDVSLRYYGVSNKIR
jgi:hypothetical protein